MPQRLADIIARANAGLAALRHAARSAVGCAGAAAILAGWLAATPAVAQAPPAQPAAPAVPSVAIDVQDDRGTRVRFAAPPRRIVSLLPSLTEAVCALGGCDRLVGVDRHSNWPASVQALPHLGGLDDTPLERLVALRPDVVLAARSSRIVGRLEGLGLAVLTLEPQHEADLVRTLDVLASLLGRPGEAAALWRRIEQGVAAEAVRLAAAARGRSVYFEVGAGPYAAGAASFVGQLFARLGLASIVPADQGAFPKLNPEFVVRARPQVVIAARRDWPALRSRPGWAAVLGPAVLACPLETAEMDLLVRPGPRMAEGARVVVQCLNAALQRSGAAQALR